MKKLNKKHIGSSFDDFLEQENLLAEANAVAIKRVLAFKLQEAMDKKGLSKSEMAKKNGHQPLCSKSLFGSREYLHHLSDYGEGGHGHWEEVRD